MNLISKKMILKKGNQKSKTKNKQQKVKDKQTKKRNEKKEEIGFSDEETGTFEYALKREYEDDQEHFRLPKITKEGIITYDQGNEEESIRNPDEKKGRKWKKQELKFKKILERSEKREEHKLKKKEKHISEKYMEKIKDKINKLEDIKEDISTLANGIIGDQTSNIANFDVLFFIFYKTLKTNKKDFINKKRMQNHTQEKGCHNNQTERNTHNIAAYLEEANILSIISICTVLKYVTPSYKLLGENADEEKGYNEEKDRTCLNGKKGKKEKKKNTEVPTRFSKLIKNINNLEKAIEKYYDEFCTILKENIKQNIVVYVNLLCEIITVNLYLSKEKGLFRLLIIYANRATYKNVQFNGDTKKGISAGQNEKTSDLLCMNCLNTLCDIIANDANLLFTWYLVQHFSAFIFKSKNNVSPSLLKAFSNLNIREKKINAKIYAIDANNELKGKINKKEELELKKKTISGDLQIIEKNIDKILDELFLIYLCVLRTYMDYSTTFVKNVLFAIADYALYINKYLMDDVLEEIKVIAKDNKTAPSLRITSMHIFLKILNKIEDNTYIDCSWICNALIYILDSTLPYFSTGSCFFLFENINFPITSFLDYREHISDENTEMKHNHENYWDTEQQTQQQTLSCCETDTKNDKRKERANFSAEILYCIDMLLKTKNFVTNFQSTNNNILCRIIYQLYNIALHSDYIISLAILKQIHFIMMKFPLIKCIIEKEGTVISSLNDNVSIFYQNTLHHASYFRDISSAALDLALNDSDEKYAQVINRHIRENNRFVTNEMLCFNLNMNETCFADERMFWDYDPQEIYKQEKKTVHQCEPIISRSKKNDEIMGKSFITPDTHTIDVAVQQLPSYQLTANDFVHMVFSPMQHFLERFQKKKKTANPLKDKCQKEKRTSYNHNTKNGTNNRPQVLTNTTKSFKRFRRERKQRNKKM